jgi:Archease protein family (MTH1598/TM1083)
VLTAPSPDAASSTTSVVLGALLVRDAGIRGFGRSRADAFEHAALAMTAAVTDPERVEPRDETERFSSVEISSAATWAAWR